MSIRPIDHQVTVSKSGDISRLHIQDQQKALVNQQAMNSTLNASSEVRLKQVRSREEIQKVRMHEREKQEKRQDRHQEKKKKEQKQTAVLGLKEDSTSFIGASIDIRL